MSNAVSALGGATYTGFVQIQEQPPHGMITLRGDFSDAKFKSALKSVCGGAVPTTRKIETHGETSIGWMSPDELLILTPYGTVNETLEALDTALAGTHFLAENVSDARALFQISGQNALIRELLAKESPVDLHPDAFAIGDLRRTRLAQVAGAFWLADEGTAYVICFRSVAQYVFDLLKVSSEAGSEVGHFA